MGIYIKNWSLADWKELLMWARIGANNAMIGEFAEVEEIPPHGRLVDVDALYAEVKKHATPSDDWVFSFIRTAPTVIPEEEGE